MTMLTAEQVSALSAVPTKTLRHWATAWDRNGEGSGPRPYRLAPRHTRYRLTDVAAWLDVDASQLTITAA